MVDRGIEVQTARVNEPAAIPERIPEGASSTTRPEKTMFSKKICVQRKGHTLFGVYAAS